MRKKLGNKKPVFRQGLALVLSAAMIMGNSAVGVSAAEVQADMTVVADDVLETEYQTIAEYNDAAATSGEAVTPEAVTPQCVAPVITTSKLVLSTEGYVLSGGIYGNGVNDSACTYYYTLDGTEPSATNGTKITGANCSNGAKSIVSNSKLLAASADENGNAVLKMVAVKDGYTNSDVMEYSFKVQPEGIAAIRDANLKTAVLKALGKTGAEVTALITKAEMETLTELDLSNSNIEYLTGLSAAANLKSLNLSGNEGISSTLTELIAMNSLENLDLSSCGIMTTTNLVKLVSLPSLKTYSVADNNLAGYFSLPASKVNVTSLDLSGNLLAGVNGGYSKELYPNLTTMDISETLVVWNDSAEKYEDFVLNGVNVIHENPQSGATLHRVWYEGVSAKPSVDADIDQTARTVSFTTLGDSVNLVFINGTNPNTAKVTIGEDKVTVLSYSNTYANAVIDGTYRITGLEEGENLIPVSVMYQDGSTVEYTLKITSVKYVPEDASGEYVYIKDALVYRALCNKLGKSYTEGYKLTKADLAKITGKLAMPICTDISWLQYCTNITALNTEDEANDYFMKDKNASTYETVPDLSGLTKLTTLVLNSTNLKEVPDLSGVTSLTTFYVSATVEGELPDVSGLENLKTIVVARSKGNMPSGINTLEKLTTVYLNNNKNASFELSNVNIPASMTMLEVNNTDTTVTIGNVTTTNGFYLRAWAGNDKIVFTQPDKVTVNNIEYKYYTGSSKDFPTNMNQLTNLKAFSLSGCKLDDELVWNESFNDMTSLTRISFSANGLTEIPKWIETATNIETLGLNQESITEFDVDLSNHTALKKIDSTGLKLESMPAAELLPVSLETLILQQSIISDFNVDYSKFTKLTELKLMGNRLYEFPSFVKEITSLQTLDISYGFYEEIPENAFGSLNNLTTLKVGNYLPVTKNGWAYALKEGTTTANEIARLSANVAENDKSLNVTVTGLYDGTVLADLERVVIGNDYYYDNNGTFNINMPAGTDSISFSTQAVYSDTTITLGEQVATGSGVFELELQDGYNEFVIKTHIDSIGELNPDGTDKEYRLSVYVGEQTSIDTMETGHYYNVNCKLLKSNTQNSSMAGGYFSEKAQIRKRVDGTYEIYLTCNKMSWVNNLSTYGEDGKRYDAEIISQDAENDILKVRVIMDSIPVPFKLNMYVAPMGYYPNCDVYLDLTSLQDITDSMPIGDTVDLSVAYNKATALTAKRNIYTDDSYSALTNAIATGEAVLANNNSSQEEIDAAKTVLTVAMEGLVIDESKLANKQELNAAINEAKALEKGNHTTTAWNALQDAIANAQTVADDIYVTQAETDSAKLTLTLVVTMFNNSGEASSLDKDNLEDGVYTVNVDMIKLDRESKSMADNTINHTIKLEVVDGKYYATLDFKGLTVEDSFGYLKNLSFYTEGYTYNQFGVPKGEVSAAAVLSTQKNADGTDVIDQYNDADNLYPDLLKIEIVPSAIADEDGYVPLHVFVPIMEAIAEGNGDQDVLMQIDWSTLKKADNDNPMIPDDSDNKPQQPQVPTTPGAVTPGAVTPGGVTAQSVTLGDVDDNGIITLADAQIVLRAALLLDELAGTYAKAADVDRSGSVELKDAQLVLRRALLLIESFDEE